MLNVYRCLYSFLTSLLADNLNKMDSQIFCVFIV